jgi:3-hydroxyisobutyrate dehydrogenase-like beta-hydroxyacid dehydrogenase
MSRLTDQPIAVIGLGLMGRPIAHNLLAAGAALTVWNRSPEPLGELVTAGAAAADSPSQLGEQLAGHTIILALWDGAAIRSTIGHEGGLLDHLAPGTLIIDMGTTDLKTTRWLHRAAESHAAACLDAPVSGGQQGAREATLSIMAGGSPEHFARAFPILECLGDKVTHCGGRGSGQITKLANQIIVAQTVAAVAEALHFAQAAGVDPATVRDALAGGFADSKILDLHGQRMLSGDFAPGGRSSGQLKDIQLAHDLATELMIELPGLSTNTQLWQSMVDAGHADQDHSAIYQHLQSLSPSRGDGRSPDGAAS